MRDWRRSSTRFHPLWVMLGGWSGGTVPQLVLGLAVLAGIVVWQVREIVGAEFPRLRAIQALFVAVPFYILTFAAAYFLIAGSARTNFAESLSRTDALYFTVTVLSTVGFGDITPKSEIARVVVTVQMVANLVLIGLGLRTLLGAAQLGLQRRSEAHPYSEAGDRFERDSGD